MTGSRLLFGLGRLCVAGFILLTSIYCLLAYIPFTYQQVHKGGLLPWLTSFVRIHPQLYWVALAIACATMVPEFRRVKTRLLAVAFLVVHAGAGVLLWLHPVLTGLGNDAASLAWSVAALVPLLWIGLLDWIGYSGDIQWAEYRKEDDRRVFHAAWRSAVFLALVYCTGFHLRATVNWGTSERIVVLFATLVCHLLVFLVLFGALNLIRSVSSLTPRPSKTEFLLSNVLTGAIGWVIVKVLVFRPISFEGRLADSYAAVLAMSLVASIAGLSARRWRTERGPADGLGLAMSPLTVARFSSRLLQPLPLVLLAGLAWLLAVKTAVMDWNYLVQKLTVLAMWVLTFACTYAMAPRSEGAPDRRMAMLLAAVAALSGYRLTAAAISPKPELGAALEKYAGYDVSFRIIRDMLSAPPKDDSFYRFLTQNSNIPRSAAVAPVDIEPAGKLTPAGGSKPNIFVIVIDSLRPDYLSPYNSAVTFTPAIDAFARESVVFRNAFTRYGGTGLAEPSIWVGGMLPHKQYVTPFYPMNTLEKLVEAEKYQSYISMDAILRTVVSPMASMVELDENRPTMDYRLNLSLAELETKIAARKTPGAPIFAYTQPQDIHISVINREKASVVDGGSYPGFYAPYASRLRQMDGGFGKFIQFLKARRLYEDSVIVLTADHGDSLGEDGRWGHAYTLVPEVVRIPLIVHVPQRFQALYHDPRAVVFQSDVTPSLYYLLGHKPTLRHEFLGRPLFTASPEEQQPRRDSSLMAASYAAVYAILADNGKSLYVADGVNYRDSLYDLDENGASPGNPASAIQKAKYEELIRNQITAINRFYRFQPPQ